MDAYDEQEEANLDDWYHFCDTVPGLHSLYQLMTAAAHTREHLDESGKFKDNYSVILTATPGPNCEGAKQEITHVYDDDAPIQSDPLFEFLRLNEKGYNIHFAPNSMGRVIDLPDDQVRFPFIVHADRNSGSAGLPLHPHICYQASPQVFISIWLGNWIYDYDYDLIMESLVVHRGGLPQYAGRSSLLPLPGTYNHDYDFQCQVDNWEIDFSIVFEKADENGCHHYARRDADARWGYGARELKDAFIPPRSSIPKQREFKDVSSLLDRPMVFEWLAQDYVEKGSLIVAQGPPEAGKSFLVIGLAACVATNTPWMGQAVKQGPVLYLAGERAGGMHRRLQAWSVHYGVSLENAPLSICDTSPNFCDSDEAASFAAELFAQVQKWGEPPMLVIFDTYTRHLGVEDENQASTVAKFMRNIERYIRQPYGAAVLLVHHQGHGAKGRARGSSKLRTDIDGEFNVKKIGHRVTLSSVKRNESEHPEPLDLELTTVVLPDSNADGSPITSAVLTRATAGSPEVAQRSKAAPRLGKHQRRALKVLKEMHGTLEDGQLIATADWLDACRDVGIDRRRLPDARSGLIDRSLVREDGDYIILI